MIRSMTGYGKGEATAEGMRLTVEIRSVNHRYNDVSLKVPRALMAREGELRKRVAERLRRGKIDVFVTQEAAEGTAIIPAVNWPLAEGYAELFRDMSARLGLESGIPLSLVVSQRDVLAPREEPAGNESGPALDAALEAALVAMEGMRRAEGEALRRDMETRLGLIEELLGQIEGRAPQVPQEWLAKLKDRLARLEADIDPQRLAQELAIFADRSDITEEIVRFRSHLQQFRLLLDNAEPVGRQMDFLAQELNREANTMGSKSNDAELTRMVVGLKAELEKVREQIQNIE